MIRNNSVGLVLSGGGGKGAYQIGVWQALKKCGIDSAVTHVSGTSVGALNACFFSMGAYDQAATVWNYISASDVLSVDASNISKWLVRLGALGITGTLANAVLKLFGTDRSDGFFSRDRLEQIIDQEIDFRALQSSNTKVYATCMKKKSLGPAYFNLNRQNAETIKAILLATSAIPVVFESHSINNEEYYDGGVVDNTPIRPLYEDGVRNFIVVYLSQSSVVDYQAFPGSRFIEIVPQNDMGNLISGTLNFNQKIIQERMKAGYSDAMSILQSYKNTLGNENQLQGKVVEIKEELKNLELKQNNANDKLANYRRQRIDLLSQLKHSLDEET
ncbi:MAG: patatin-like phospholipase family protein [Bacteroidia bacterium]|nr:patatin-like phospholipase family protein [Bacteroidia bacterium]